MFTKQDLSDLDDMYVEDEYSDSYYSTAYGLYNNALKELENRVKPLYNFTMNMSNLTKAIHHPYGWDNIISIGDIYKVDDEELINEIKELQKKSTMLEYHHDDSYKEVDKIIESKVLELNEKPAYKEYLNKMNEFNDILAMSSNMLEKYVRCFSYLEIW